MDQIIPFLFGLLAVVPTIVLAMHGRRTHTMHVHHFHHHEGPPAPQARYQVITGGSSAYVVDAITGERYPIVQPIYKAVTHEPI